MRGRLGAVATTGLGLVARGGTLFFHARPGGLAQLSLGLLFLAVLLVPGSPAQATNGAAEVKLSIAPEVPWVRPGDTVTFALHADPGEGGISAAQITLTYGRDLELVGVRPGPFLGDETIAGPAEIDAEKGEATFAWARIGDAPVPTPPSVLAFVTMKADAEAYYWYAWFRARIRLADQELRQTEEILPWHRVHVYRTLPVPWYRAPSWLTGPSPTFALYTQGPATFRYRIEVSQDNFQTVLQTYDQTLSQEGWDKEQYTGAENAEFTPPEPLEPGVYQWRAAAWVEEVGEWGEPRSYYQTFQVMPTPMGITSVRPELVARIDPREQTIYVDGWGFTEGTTARLTSPGSADMALDPQIRGTSRLTARSQLPSTPGLWTLEVATPEGETASHPMVVMPTTLFRVSYFSPPRRIMPGRPFRVSMSVRNGGTEEGAGVVSLSLPEEAALELVDVQGADLLAQGTGQVALAVSCGGGGGRCYIRVNLRLPPEVVAFPGTEGERPVALGESFSFRAEVLGSVSQARWDEIKAMETGALIQAVQEETAQRLEQMAPTFNAVPPAVLEQGLERLMHQGAWAPAILDLVVRMQRHGLDTSRVAAILLLAPEGLVTDVLEQIGR